MAEVSVIPFDLPLSLLRRQLAKRETVALGRKLAAVLPDGALIAFTGGLGAGKTAFCEGLAEGLGCTDPVSSPTFAIVNYYRGPRPLAHFDLYRISTENDLCAAGFYDYLDQGAIVAAEWSENFADLLAPEDPIYINIDRVDDTTRRITIEGVSV
ncbi:MAG: tRNA (adenosine(37)-N6)-threonylcarbamoyltransferase complex ATPase subunit type 1 TsaE [Faecalibacterium prausnitzii]|nr:MAG: tRNA (adenosine(37)-N6)-threonylcarbamoyltransferase complex ATPase subunit type 1 TsaE [Faecalibacterium prausnitzii]